jgi:Cu/Ag efflux pump CusA
MLHADFEGDRASPCPKLRTVPEMRQGLGRPATPALAPCSAVVSQVGRPDSGTETTGFFSCELSVELEPDFEWPRELTKHELVQEIDAQLRREFPGVTFDYSQNIEANINEALSGVKGSNSVKVFGSDLSAR